MGLYNARRCLSWLLLLLKDLDVNVYGPCNWQVTVQTLCKSKQDCTMSTPKGQWLMLSWHLLIDAHHVMRTVLVAYVPVSMM